MENLIIVIVVIGIPLVGVLIIRLLGAWMLRINEVIRELKEIKNELKRIR